jgi:putative membrane protein
MTEAPTEPFDAIPDVPDPAPDTMPPVVRTGVAGGLMGLANLVPGVSGGTMVLVMGVYDRFVDAAAGVSRGKLTKARLVFLAVLVACAGVSIVGLASVMNHLVTTYEATMYSLFIGMTLAGTGLLWKMADPLARPIKPGVVVAFLAGFAAMAALAVTEDPAAKEQAREIRESGNFQPTPDYVRDAAGGTLAMSAMVLPGISGAHMLLVLGRYEHVTGAISLLKTAGLDGDMSGIRTALSILVPVGLAAVVSLVLLSNVLKWALAHHSRTMGGGLLGILWGSVLAIWPFTIESATRDYTLGLIAFVVGFGVVFALTLLAPKEPT